VRPVNRRAFLATGTALVGAALYGGRTAAATGKSTAAATGKSKAPSRAAAVAVAWARARTGLPYLYGGTGPDAFDCSGLAMMAYRAAGVTIPRTSQEQWAAGPQVTDPQPGDLVFFPGGDGTWQAPGHVAIVAGPGRIVQAYAPGVPIGTYPYGVPSALEGTGPGTVIGYTRPWAGT
jgi:cell wall-associated NlpC family hydrolase